MRYHKIALFFISILFSLSSIAQGTDISKINIDDLSDDQVVQLANRASLSGLSEEEMEKKAIAAGFTTEQISKLKARLARIGSKSGNNSQSDNNSSTGRGKAPDNTSANASPSEKRRSKVFGAEFFSNQNLTFEPDLKIATPSNYILGPGDKVNIDIYGYSDVQFKLEVSPDGYIRIPNVGPVFVSGLSFEEAKARVRKQLATVFSGINTGKTSFQMVLGEIRSIRVTLIGEVMRPASYTLPSLATVANALYLSGGPSLNGSFRAIDLVRNGKTVASFDFYDFLLHGDLSKNMLLRDQDVIRVNPYIKRVELAGAVKRQAIFEMKEKETLKDLIQFSGGFADTANKELITAYRISGREKEIVNIPLASQANFDLQTGDSLVVNGVINRYKNRVSIGGSVFYPGNYSLTQASTLKELLAFAQLKESAFKERGVIRRLLNNYTPSMIDFNVDQILSGQQSVTLQREDSVHIYNVEEIREKYTVKINGEINHPSDYNYSDSMKLEDLILIAGGFKEGASGKRVEIARRLRDANNPADSMKYAIVSVIDIDKSLSGAQRSYVLQPFDVVSIRKLPNYKKQIIVKIEGEVNYPGEYSISDRNERLTDLIQRAGGLKSVAYAEGAILLRNTYEVGTDTATLNNKLRILGKQNQDTSSLNAGGKGNVTKSLVDEQKTVGIRLNEAMAIPGSLYDIYLEEGDVLKVPKKLQTVQTFGAVNLSQKIIYRDNMNLEDAVRESGGYAAGAIKRRAYVVQANGEVNSTRHFLFFNFYPKVRPGSEVYVPSRGVVKPLSTTEIIGISSSIVGLGAIIISLLNSFK